MKTISPFIHGLSNGASLTTDISGTRYNIPYIRAVSSRYSTDEKQTHDYLLGQKIGMYGSVALAIVALSLIGIAAFLWESEAWAVAIAIIWQGVAFWNAFYAIKYEQAFISGKV